MPRIARSAPSPDPNAAPASTFLRGLTMGALVGAAVAGSLLFGRRRRPVQPLDEKRPEARAG
jgi:hypothetical protein